MGFHIHTTFLMPTINGSYNFFTDFQRALIYFFNRLYHYHTLQQIITRHSVPLRNVRNVIEHHPYPSLENQHQNQKYFKIQFIEAHNDHWRKKEIFLWIFLKRTEAIIDTNTDQDDESSDSESDDDSDDRFMFVPTVRCQRNLYVKDGNPLQYRWSGTRYEDFDKDNLVDLFSFIDGYFSTYSSFDVQILDELPRL